MRYTDLLTEDASSGATCASNVAVVVGGLGAGDPAASIYHTLQPVVKKHKKKVKRKKSMPIIKRNM